MDDILSSEEISMLLDKQEAEEVPKNANEVFEDFSDGNEENFCVEENASANSKLDLILDIPLKISVVLGKAKKTIKEITDVVPGSIIELDQAVDEPLEVYANGKKIAEGEAVVINEKFCIRITKIVSKRELFKNL